MYTQEITVNNEVGLHARPATFFIQKANEFKSGIWRLMREFPEVELIPVYIENLHRAMPKGVYIPVPTICSVHFGAPLEHSPDDPKEVFLTRARQAVIDLAQQQ